MKYNSVDGIVEGNDKLKSLETDENIQWATQVTRCLVSEIGGRGQSTEKSGGENFGGLRQLYVALLYKWNWFNVWLLFSYCPKVW